MRDEGPHRRCVGCGRVRAKAELLRFVVDGGRLRPSGRKQGGRGAYLCPCRSCLRAAYKKGAFSRAFKTKVTLPSEEDLWNSIKGYIKEPNTTYGRTAG